MAGQVRRQVLEEQVLVRTGTIVVQHQNFPVVGLILDVPPVLNPVIKVPIPQQQVHRPVDSNDIGACVDLRLETAEAQDRIWDRSVGILSLNGRVLSSDGCPPFQRFIDLFLVVHHFCLKVQNFQ